MNREDELKACTCEEAKEYTQSELNRKILENVEPLRKQISELCSQNLKLKMAIRTLADAMTP